MALMEYMEQKEIPWAMVVQDLAFAQIRRPKYADEAVLLTGEHWEAEALVHRHIENAFLVVRVKRAAHVEPRAYAPAIEVSTPSAPVRKKGKQRRLPRTPNELIDAVSKLKGVTIQPKKEHVVILRDGQRIGSVQTRSSKHTNVDESVKCACRQLRRAGVDVGALIA